MLKKIISGILLGTATLGSVKAQDAFESEFNRIRADYRGTDLYQKLPDPHASYQKEAVLQKKHAGLLPRGDLYWTPEPFEFEKGSSVRYIDFEGGHDQNDGLSPSTAWKHHPWDVHATGLAGKCTGGHTYVFKKGVIYRGRLIGEESGTSGDPIRLTLDPEWGMGSASIYGSERVVAGWKKLPEKERGRIPGHSPVWYLDLEPDLKPGLLWEVREDSVMRIPIARYPNWEIVNPDFPQSQWLVIDRVTENEDGSYNLVDRNLSFPSDVDPGDWFRGVTLWSQLGRAVDTEFPQQPLRYDPEKKAFVCNRRRGSTIPTANSLYFLENLPQFLDEDGEFYYSDSGEDKGRLYLRLPGDRDPNLTIIEIAREEVLVDIRNQSHIKISGLTFRFNNTGSLFSSSQSNRKDMSAIRFLGDMYNVQVRHCSFEHVTKAVLANPLHMGDVMNSIVVTDNRVSHTDHEAFLITNTHRYADHSLYYADLRFVAIMRNSLYNLGQRPYVYNDGHAMLLEGSRITHIAGNIIHTVAASGIHVHHGKQFQYVEEQPFKSRMEVPFVSGFIHHNRVENSMLRSRDWGGIESWSCGPVFMYNNVSGNSVGWAHSKKHLHGHASHSPVYYFDHQYKGYLFNNIGWGKCNDIDTIYNSYGITEWYGFLNYAFQNTFFRFQKGMIKGRELNRNVMLANVFEDINGIVFDHEPAEPEFESLIYSRNVINGDMPGFAEIGDTAGLSRNIAEFRRDFADGRMLLADGGVESEEGILVRPEDHDFRPRPGSPAIDQGARVFVPWPLYAVVGEWNFYKSRACPAAIPSYHVYHNDEWISYRMYPEIPRTVLKGNQIGAEDYTWGAVDDWIMSALHFNGSDQYLHLSDEELHVSKEYRVRGGEISYDGRTRKTLDMDTNSFCIEIIFRAGLQHKGGTLVSKRMDQGYELSLDGDGRIALAIFDRGKKVCERRSSFPLNNGSWYHVLAEADRSEEGGGIAVYVNGAVSQENLVGKMPDTKVSLSNRADFLVGRGNEPGSYFSGDIDFLRISRGTLSDAYTDIGELVSWEFNGPHLKDFFGNEPTGITRDAGAIEWEDPGFTK